MIGRSGIAWVVLFCFVGLLGCAKGSALSAEDCERWGVTIAELSILIADVATSDEEKQAAVERYARLGALMVSYGCPVVIDLIDDAADQEARLYELDEELSPG